MNLFLGMLRRIIIGRKAQAAFKAKPSGAREIPVQGDFASVKNGLKRRGFRCRVAFEDERAASLFARRGLPKRLIYICFHLFFGISIFGFILSAMTKFDGSIDLEIGDVQSVPTSSGNMAFYRFFKEFDPERVQYVEIELRDYEMQYVPFRMGYFPKDYISTLFARSADREKEMTVEVNRPLKFAGLTFFQWSYTQRFELAVGADTLSLEGGDAFSVNGIQGKFMTRSVYVGKVFTDSGVSDLVPNGKLYHMGGSGGWEEVGKLVEDEPMEVMGKEMVMQNVREVSGIYYTRDDGVPLLYVAFFLFMVGMCLRVFFHSYEIRLFFDKSARIAYVKGKASGLATYIEREIDEIQRSFAADA
jgi:cytochrome c biogenesis protein ResB